MPAKDLDRAFVAAILRNASDNTVLNTVVEQRVEEARRVGYEQGAQSVTDARELNQLRLKAEAAKAFEDAAGIYFHETASWSHHTAKQVGETVKLILTGGADLQRRVDGLRYLLQTIDELKKAVQKQVTTVESAAHALTPPPPVGADEVVF